VLYVLTRDTGIYCQPGGGRITEEGTLVRLKNQAIAFYFYVFEKNQSEID